MKVVWDTGMNSDSIFAFGARWPVPASSPRSVLEILRQVPTHRVRDRVPHLSCSNPLDPECTDQTRPAVRFGTMPRGRHQMLHFGPQFGVERTKQVFDHLAIVTDALCGLRNS